MAYTGAGKVAPAPVRLAAAKAEKALIDKVAATTVATVVRITFIMSPAGIRKSLFRGYGEQNRSKR
ncbi:hypothetical protein KPHVMX_420072 [Klebsiella pneumoniae]|nr:hypothetical protein KPHVMX_420072 [Klebsiella pneumoniae]